MNIQFDGVKSWLEPVAVRTQSAQKTKPAPFEPSDTAVTETFTPKQVEVRHEFQESIERVRERTRNLIDALRNGENPFSAQLKGHREDIEGLLR